MAEDPAHTAPTLFLLMAQYNGQTVVPLDQVCRDFFGHLTVDKLLRKALRGDIALPIVRIETSQKAQRGVHLVDLAAYIDKRRSRRFQTSKKPTRENRPVPLSKGANKRQQSPNWMRQPSDVISFASLTGKLSGVVSVGPASELI